MHVTPDTQEQIEAIRSAEERVHERLWAAVEAALAVAEHVPVGERNALWQAVQRLGQRYREAQLLAQRRQDRTQTRPD